MVGLFAGMHHDGYLIAQIFFGLWLLPLGYLVLKSGWFPAWIGALLIAGCFGYLVDTFATFLAPSARRRDRGDRARSGGDRGAVVRGIPADQGRAGSRRGAARARSGGSLERRDL